MASYFEIQDEEFLKVVLASVEEPMTRNENKVAIHALRMFAFGVNGPNEIDQVIRELVVSMHMMNSKQR